MLDREGGGIVEELCCSRAEVLLVDDIMFNLIPLKALMECNFKQQTCDMASDGSMAVDLYLRNIKKTCCNVRYKLILTDIQMPIMDGITEARQIKVHEKALLEQNPSLPTVRIVMVSAYEGAESMQELRQIGVHDYLQKPVSLDGLIPICNEVWPGKNFGLGE